MNSINSKILKQELKQLSLCIVVPTYNNAGTIVGVLEKISEYAEEIIVVNDGCTDNTAELLKQFDKRIIVIEYGNNRGKGYALKRGIERARERGFKYIITIDSDGQHYPEEIALFAEEIQKHPNSLIVGNRNLQSDNMPGKNTFANRFSNFWFYVQTGHILPDTQTGFRLYPVHKLCGLKLLTYRYEAELELLVFAAWNGVEIRSVPIRVYYPPEGERVTHFHPAKDFARISLLNTVLCLGAIVYGLPAGICRMFRRRENE